LTSEVQLGFSFELECSVSPGRARKGQLSRGFKGKPRYARGGVELPCERQLSFARESERASTSFWFNPDASLPDTCPAGTSTTASH
jgi:hypothetical protein